MNQPQTKDDFPLWSILGFTVLCVFASSALIAFRHWTTSMESAGFVCLFYGGVLFLPLCLGVILTQFILRRLTNRNWKSRRVLHLVLLLAPPVLLLLVAINYAHISQLERERAFQRFLPTKSQVVRVLTYGYERTALGDGTYVFIFEMPEDELKAMLKIQGYELVGFDWGNWRLELCNDIIQRLTRAPVQITPDYECYGIKRTSVTAARVLYKQGQTKAVFIGVGRY